MTDATAARISTVSADDLARHLGEFGALLHACVLGGASIGFVLPFGREEAEAFWSNKVLPGVASGSRVLLVARAADRIAGSAQLNHDTPANQPHRADVSKLMVHPDFRRRGIARALMAEIERQARLLGRSLLTLDTRTGDSAEPLYASMGYAVSGIIPGYCLDVGKTRFDSTTVMYKAL
jgi:ribosomal protein S18 acetylase RimI-like enzyme